MNASVLVREERAISQWGPTMHTARKRGLAAATTWVVRKAMHALAVALFWVGRGRSSSGLHEGYLMHEMGVFRFICLSRSFLKGVIAFQRRKRRTKSEERERSERACDRESVRPSVTSLSPRGAFRKCPFISQTMRLHAQTDTCSASPDLDNKSKTFRVVERRGN